MKCMDLRSMHPKRVLVVSLFLGGQFYSGPISPFSRQTLFWAHFGCNCNMGVNSKLYNTVANRAYKTAEVTLPGHNGKE